jgi:FtsP/CotA-like multicopper oxidase with cupredoxin domain
MDRRNFLKLGVAGAVLSGTGALTWIPRAHAATISKTFYITEGLVRQIDGTDVYFRGFSRSDAELNVPGEHMIVQEGDTVRITIINTLNTDHRFVIDGMVDSGTIDAGTSKTFSFTASNPGTHFYYDSHNAPYNRLSGLHGGFAVMPSGRSDELFAGSRRFVQQHFWLFHDIDPAWHAEFERGRTPSTPYVPRYFTLNGLGGRPPGAPGSGDPAVDAMHDPRSALHGHIGDRTLLRVMNAGLCAQSVHTHANHMEWLTENGQRRDDVWEKDCIYLDGDMGRFDAIFPFETPPDSWPPVATGKYPMHLHSEMSQTAAGGYYMFGALTDIFFE